MISFFIPHPRACPALLPLGFKGNVNDCFAGSYSSNQIADFLFIFLSYRPTKCKPTHLPKISKLSCSGSTCDANHTSSNSNCFVCGSSSVLPEKAKNNRAGLQFKRCRGIYIRELKQRRRRRQREWNKTNRFRLAKQQLCACITLFCTFLSRR